MNQRADLSPTGMLPCDLERIAGTKPWPPAWPAHEPVNAPRVFAWLSVAAAALLALLLALSGCSPITHEQLLKLDRSIRNERQATVPREGFEDDVAALRTATNTYLDAALKATE